MNRKELYETIRDTPEKFLGKIEWYDKNGRFWTSRYSLDGDKSLSKLTKAELQRIYDNKDTPKSVERVNMTVSKFQ